MELQSVHQISDSYYIQKIKDNGKIVNRRIFILQVAINYYRDLYTVHMEEMKKSTPTEEIPFFLIEEC